MVGSRGRGSCCGLDLESIWSLEGQLRGTNARPCNHEGEVREAVVQEEKRYCSARERVAELEDHLLRYTLDYTNPLRDMCGRGPYLTFQEISEAVGRKKTDT